MKIINLSINYYNKHISTIFLYYYKYIYFINIILLIFLSIYNNNYKYNNW